METLAYGVGVVAAMIALWLALTGYGTPRDRMVRFAIPSPLFVGAPICGVDEFSVAGRLDHGVC